ncbi:ATP-binding cassette sub-family A member 10-like isoform X3 [Nycticebus coucang]|uniref:ATP-binding cassette sub-family A member 10-like isoform X3 n=1 Tax=Nycticebus coucang TaxID=9470 RepID=UPI00234C90DD|nr:ATP-binding cassette sub-family A member 10-like isoform X3 [Nycticebus coucang]
MLGRIVVLKDLYRDLNKCSDQDIMNYGISMTALKEVLSNLQGKSAIDEPGSNIEDLMHSLLCQDIVLEVDDFSNRNGSDDPSHNGDIIVSGEQKGASKGLLDPKRRTKTVENWRVVACVRLT